MGVFYAIIPNKMPMWRKVFKVRQGKRSLLAFFRSIFLTNKTQNEPAVVDELTSGEQGLGKSRKRYAIASVIVAGLCIFLIAAPAHADNAKELVNWIIAIFTKILVYIMELLSFILLFLLDYLIQIVQFNTFVNAAPVRIGWPLIRDTVNMFFIVVVLVSAFATIIGQPKEFHYRGILPKLLVMAVLINFSKTLIGLMIDFSQVLVLTFVNGFKDAAGGNFINALHIRETMSIETAHGSVIQESEGSITINANAAENASVYQIFNMMLAAIFGIWILSLSITLVIIMLVFFLVRIIVLWFLLITSPVMFFAWSLPGKMQKSFSAFTDQWWQRLSTALIGGPTMAFFLWLALAMAQTQGGSDSLTGSGASSLYKGTSQEVKSNIEGLSQQEGYGNKIVSTEIGKPENMANFIIMVAFMLLGVQVAVQSSNSLAPKLGSLAGAIGSTGGAMGIGVAGTIAAGKLLEKGVRGGATKVGGAINERYGISNKVAGAVGRAGWVPMTKGARIGLMQHAAEPKKRAMKMSEEMKSAVSQEDPLEQENFFRKMASSGNVATSMAGNMALASLSGSSLYAKKLQKSEEAGARKDIISSKAYKDKYGTGPLTDAQKKELDGQVEALARRRADAKITQLQDEAKTFAEKTNNTKLMDEINDMRGKDPSKQGKIGDIESTVAKIMSDHNGHTKLKDDAYMDSATFVAAMKSKGWMDKDANLTVSESDKDFQDFMKGAQGKHIRGHLDYIRNSKEGRENAIALMDSSKKDDERQKARYALVAGKDGKGYSVIGQDGKVTYLNMGGQADTRNEILENVKDVGTERKADLVSAYETQLSTLGKSLTDTKVRYNNDRIKGATNNLRTINANQGPAGDAGTRQEAMADMLAKNQISYKALFDIDDKGEFTGPKAAQNMDDFRELVSSSMTQARSATTPEVAAKHIEVVSSLAEAAKSSGGQALTQMTEAVQADLEGFKHAYDNSGSAQRASIAGAMKRVGSEAEAAEAKRKSVSGTGTISPDEQKRIEFKGQVAIKRPTGATKEERDHERSAIQFTRSLLRGDKG